MPAGSGLGSSSSFTVGLLNALYAYRGQLKSAEELAKLACHVELDLLKEPIGKQDQYIAAYGGFKYIQFNTDGNIYTEPIIYPKEKKEKLADNLILIHTGSIRKAGSILSEVKDNINGDVKVQLLKSMSDMAVKLKQELNGGCEPDILATYLHNGWLQKKKLASSISNSRVDEYYERALASGALGGKIMGAGGEGFMLFYCPKEKQSKLIDEMKGLYPTKISLEPEGSKIIFIS
jgi:D-glycero-alpha-D-manno-heptose-7-phosphate kinase